ncbi:MAG: response regulator [Rhodobacterales bacterium]|nr:response regulator [Rhodobacterales bacterium]
MPHQSIRVLIADDHPFVRRIVVTVLADMAGAHLIEAEDGVKALFELGVVLTHAFPTDGSLPPMDKMTVEPKTLSCVITDFNMPGVNGLQLLRMIRTGRTGVRRDLPVIMLTGFNEDPLVAAALNLDVNGFVTKPVTKAILAEKILDSLRCRLDLKTPEDYLAVAPPESLFDNKARAAAIQAAGPAVEGGEPEAEADAPPEEEDDGTIRVKVDAVPEGAVLAENILSKKGTLMLAKGAKLSLPLIKRLREIADIVGLSEIRVEVESA